MFLAALGADGTQIEASFCEAIRIAKQQKAVSLEKRAEATYAEYRSRRATASSVQDLRLRHGLLERAGSQCVKQYGKGTSYRYGRHAREERWIHEDAGATVLSRLRQDQCQW